MRNLTFFLLMVMFIAGLLTANVMADKDKDRKAVEATALDYIEGWYEGNVARMESCLHPDLRKRDPLAPEA